MPKCHWCKDNGEKDQMYCDEKPTGKFNKNGSPKMFRKYFHSKCHELFLNDKEYKKNEATKLNDLYIYIRDLHGLISLDERMMEKIQDLRNGTIKIANKKVKKYKSGVPYELMLQTYRYNANTIDDVMRKMHFKEKWNEFSYIFGIITKSVNDVNLMNIQKEKIDAFKSKVSTESIEIDVKKKEVKRVDEMDISDIL